MNPSESDMLDWIGTYVTDINSLYVTGKRGGERIEIVAADEESMIIIRRRGQSLQDAFRKCVIAGMKQLQKKKG